MTSSRSMRQPDGSSGCISHQPSQLARLCCGRVNRGLAILDNTLFMGTIDGHLVAVDAKSGRLIWDVALARKAGYSLTLAPLVVKDKVIVGPAGGEYGIRGFLAAFDARTGKQVWRFNTVAGPGERGGETWGGDSWKTGGGSIWVTGSYDPDLNLTYWGIGNAGPDRNGDSRPGDNLYTASVVALDADTGQLKWHYQFSPHDEFDQDATQIAVWQISVAGQTAEADVVGESERVLLRPRPRHGPVSLSQAIRPGDVGRWLRRTWSTTARRSGADAERHDRVSG